MGSLARLAFAWPVWPIELARRFLTTTKGESSSEITFGTGQVSGDFYKDDLCVGESLCFNANFISADQMTTEPFREIPFDGIMGLGFKDLGTSGRFTPPGLIIQT